MNKPASELIALAEAALEYIDAIPKDVSLPAMPGFDRDWANEVLHRARTAANQSGSERAGVDALTRGQYVVRKGGYFYRPNAQGYTSSIYEAGLWPESEARKYADSCEEVSVHAASEFTPPAQPAPAVIHGKPDVAVREAVCCSSISPCEYQRTHRTGVCETCQKAAAIDRLDVKAEAKSAEADEEKELFAAVTKIDLAGAVKHLRNWAAYKANEHCQEYANLIEAQARLIAWFVKERAIKAEAKSQEPVVAVKPLEWYAEPLRSPDQPAWNADSPVGTYRVFKAWWGKENKDGWIGNGEFHHAEADAKAAAQADYEQRIRSALILPRPKVPVSLDAIKALIRTHVTVSEAATAIAALIDGER